MHLSPGLYIDLCSHGRSNINKVVRIRTDHPVQQWNQLCDMSILSGLLNENYYSLEADACMRLQRRQPEYDIHAFLS